MSVGRCKKAMRKKSIGREVGNAGRSPGSGRAPRHLSLFAGIVVIAAALLVGCLPIGLLTDLQQKVHEAKMGPQPTMVVQQAEATIANGGVCSAFAGAVQGVPLDVVFTISNTGNSDLHLRDNTPIN